MIFAKTIAVCSLCATLATPTQASSFDPAAFPLLGVLNLNDTSGPYVFDLGANGAEPTLHDPNGTALFVGVRSSNTSVFNFSEISIGSDVVTNVAGQNPLALLSSGNINIAGTINANTLIFLSLGSTLLTGSLNIGASGMIYIDSMESRSLSPFLSEGKAISENAMIPSIGSRSGISSIDRPIIPALNFSGSGIRIPPQSILAPDSHVLTTPSLAIINGDQSLITANETLTAVPIPAAFWLFSSVLAIGRIFRKRRTD